MEDQIREFLEYLQNNKSYARNTVEAYRNDLGQFLRFVQNERPHLNSWALVDRPLLLSFLEHLKERKYTAASIARKVAVIKTFYHYLSDRHLISEDPTAKLDSPKVEKRLPQILSPEQVEQLLAASAKRGTPKGFRDRAILELLYASGLRVTELVSLNLENANLETKTIHCVGRGERVRAIPISARAIDAVANYMERGRPVLAANSEERALFLNPRGDRLTRQGLWLIIKEYVKEAGIQGEVTPHTLRHSFAAHSLSRGENLENIQRLLGHSSITTTQVYARLAQTDHAEPAPDSVPVNEKA
jgi:integrase/recombinase XerD